MSASSTRSQPSERRALRDVLEGALASPNAPRSTIRRFSVRRSLYASTHPLRVVRVELHSGESIELLLKDLSAARTLAAARGVKPERLVDPRREIHAYQDVLRGRALGTPALYASVVDEAADRYWLLIERVDGSPLWQVGDFETWKAAAQWLAEMHDATRDVAANPDGLLLTHDEEELRRWPRLALGTARPATPALRRLLRHLARNYETVVELLTSHPATFLHGEFYASNVLIAESGRRVCAVDWEMAGTGPAELDVAPLAAGWNEPERTMLVNAYRDACASPTATSVFERTVEAARLHNALRWLGWSPGWTPPTEHRTDWAREAADAAERLGM